MNFTGGGNLIVLPEDIETGCMFASNGYTVFYVGDNPNIPDVFIKAPILLPPVSAVACDLEGDMQNYNAIYYSHLKGNDTASYIIDSIIIAFCQGMKLALLIENQDLSHLGFLLRFFNEQFGIGMGTPMADCTFTPTQAQLLNVYTCAYCTSLSNSTIINAQDYIMSINAENYEHFLNFILPDPMHCIADKLFNETGYDYMRNPGLIYEQSVWLNDMVNRGLQLDTQPQSMFKLKE